MVIAPDRAAKRPPRSKRQSLPSSWYRRIQAARILRRCDGQLTKLGDKQLSVLLRSIIASRKDGVL
jgi:hypothetical protein